MVLPLAMSFFVALPSCSGVLVTFGSLVTRAYTPRGFLSWLVSGVARAGAVRR